MATFLRSILGLVLGAVVGAFGLGGLIQLLSSNTHDKSVEAAMTGAFVGGPLGAICGVGLALYLSRRKPSGAAGSTPDR